jgi:hypothetical protein
MLALPDALPVFTIVPDRAWRRLPVITLFRRGAYDRWYSTHWRGTKPEKFTGTGNCVDRNTSIYVCQRRQVWKYPPERVSDRSTSIPREWASPQLPPDPKAEIPGWKKTLGLNCLSSENLGELSNPRSVGYSRSISKTYATRNHAQLARA